MSFFVRARFEVRDQRQHEFEEAALALRDQAREEPGALNYRWFSAGAGSYLVIEEYVDSAAAMAHNARGAHLLARLNECAEMVSAELYGPLGPEVREWVEAHPQAIAFPEFPGHGTEG